MSEPVYKITRWRETFERMDRRRITTMKWFSHPADLSSTGLAVILRDHAGLAALGLWSLLLQSVASLPAERRDGTILRSDGRPSSAIDLSRRFGIPVETVGVLIGILSRQDVGWLQVEANAADHDLSCSIMKDQAYITEQNKTRHEIKTPPMPPSPGGESESELASTADIESKPKPKQQPRARRATKRVGALWPDGWTFGDAEWAIAHRCGAPSRESASRAFESFETWAREGQVESPAWGLRWSSWCQRARDKYGWPAVVTVHAEDAERRKTRELIERQRKQREANQQRRAVLVPPAVGGADA